MSRSAGIAGAILILAAIGAVALAQGTGKKCDWPGTATAAFVACTIAALEDAEKGALTDKAIASEPVSRYLAQIGESLAHDARPEDLEKLKARSLKLKADPNQNRSAIAKLDAAIASHRTEFRALASPAIAVNALPSTSPNQDFFADFVQRKLTYFRRGKAAFYEGGPFEVSIRALHATTLEEQYFLDRKARTDLIQAHKITDEALDRLTGAKKSYLSNSQRAGWVNDFRFTSAVLQFALGEKDGAMSRLRELILRNQDFGLGRPVIDHVYISKVFSTPYKLFKAPPPANIRIEDDELIKRFYNPAQLALFICARIDKAGPDAAEQLAKDIRGLSLADYYVVVASSDERQILDGVKKALEGALKRNDMTEALRKTRENMALLETTGYSEAMRDGAKRCGIDDAVKAKIHAPLSLNPEIREIASFGKYRFHVLLGGHLNMGQARALSEFLNTSAFSAIRPTLQNLGIENTAYIARMRIDG